MKNSITYIALLITAFVFSQSGINYKAIIKDGTGNILASSPVSIQFIIYEGAALTNNVYQESHVTNTDANGLINVNIGEGITADVFSAINWGSDEHWLNVQVNTGSGLVDLGSSVFNTVPYALEAANVKGLVPLDQGNGVGWRITGRGIPGEYGAIGLNAVDLSYCTDGAIPRGAMGDYATAMGNHTIANGLYSTTMGNITSAYGKGGTAMGFGSAATGDYSVAMGTSFAKTFGSVSIGAYNAVTTGDSSNWILTEPVFEIGVGTSSSNRANAMTVLKNGNVGIGTTTPFDALHVFGRIRFESIEYFEDGGATEIAANGDLRPVSNNFLDLGTPTFRWDDVYATNGTINTSDRRDKSNIRDMSYGLDEIMQLQPVSYTWKGREKEGAKLGLIAQDLLEVIPEVVKTHDWQAIDESENATQVRVEMERMGVYYSDLIPVLIKSIQEQQMMLQELKHQNNDLKKDLEILKSKSN